MLRWAIIGSGDVVNRLVKESFNSKFSSVKYVYSKDFKQAKKICKKYNYGNSTNNLKEILDDKSINCVYIATPPSSHYEFISLFSKKKTHILCEKPIVLEKKHLRQITKLIKKNKISFYGCFYRREQKRFKYIKELLKKKEIGKVLSFDYKLHHTLKSHPTAPILTKKNIPWRFDKKISGGGNFLDMGLHVVDFLFDTFGECEYSQYLSHKSKKIYNVEESFILNLKFKNGILGQCAWHSSLTETKDIFKIYGEKGIIEFSFNFSDKIKIIKNNKAKILNIKFTQPPHKPIITKVIKIFSENIKRGKIYLDQKSLNLTNIQISLMN